DASSSLLLSPASAWSPRAPDPSPPRTARTRRRSGPTPPSCRPPSASSRPCSIRSEKSQSSGGPPCCSSRRARPRRSSMRRPVSTRSRLMRRSLRRAPCPSRRSRCSPSEFIGLGGPPGSRDDGNRCRAQGAAAPGTRAPRVGLDRVAVGVAQPCRRDRAAPPAVLLPVLPTSHRAGELLPASSGGRHAVFDPEHRQLVPVRFRCVPYRTAAPGHSRRVAPCHTLLFLYCCLF